MEKAYTEIGEQLRRITHAKSGRLLSGVVKNVDVDAGTCDVLLTLDGDDQGGGTMTQAVTMNVITGNVAGLYMVPDRDADCVVMEVDGPGNMLLLTATKYKKIVATVGSSTFTATDGLFQFNDGSLGGMTKTLELQTQINKLNTLVMHLVSVINGIPVPEPGSGAASALQASLAAAIATDSVGDFSNIEDIKVKH